MFAATAGGLALVGATAWAVWQRSRPLVLGTDGEQAWTLSFSPSSELLAAATGTAAVRVWSTSDGRLVRTLVHPAAVTSAAFSPDGSKIVTGSTDGVIRLWSLATGELDHGLYQAGAGRITAVAFSPDGALLVAACFLDYVGQENGGGPHVEIWSTRERRLLQTLHDRFALAWLDFSPRGDRLVGCDPSGGVILLRSIPDSTPVRWTSGTADPLAGLTSRGGSASFSRDGSRLAVGTAAEGALVEVFSMAADTPLGPVGNVLPERTGRGLAWSPQGDVLALEVSHGLDTELRLVDAESGRLVRVWRAPGRRSLSCGPVQFSPDGEQIAVAGWGPGVCLFRTHAPLTLSVEAP